MCVLHFVLVDINPKKRCKPDMFSLMTNFTNDFVKKKNEI